MEQTLISLINAAAGVKTTTAASEALSSSGTEGLFADLLCRAVNEGGKAAAASATETDGAKAPLDLAELLAALVGKGDSGLAGALQSAAAGSLASAKDASRAVTETSDVRTGASAAASNGGGATGTVRGKPSDTVNGGSNAGRDLQNLLTGLLALVMKDNAGAAESSGTTTGDAAGDEKTAADATAASQTADAAAAGDKSKQDGQSILQALGLLLFAGLEAAAAGQNGAAAVSGQTQGQAQGETQGRSQGETAQAQGNAASATLLVSQRRTCLAGKSVSGAVEAGPVGARAEETDVPAYAAATAQKSPAQDERTAVPRMATASVALKENETAKNNVTLTIKTAQNVNGEASLTVVKELATTMDAGGGTGSDGNGTGKEKSADREVYPLTPDNGSSATSVSAQEQKPAGTASVSGSIERFDKVIEQVASKSGSHDLTVRLTLDNHESLVLGLKDLGQSITVDVRSSDQGMIGLLQSQKETIMQHLDSQDVRAQIVIDPNAYGTPEQKGQQQESRQRSFTPRKPPDATFGAFLETFA